MIVCTEPLPKVCVPMTVARLWSWRAPATISEAEAEPPFTSTTIGTVFTACGSDFSTSSPPPPRPAPAAALIVVGGRVELLLRVFRAAVGGHHQRLGRQEGRRDRDRAVQQAAWVVAQVEHQAFQVGVLLEHLGDLLDHVLGGGLLELRDPHPAVARLDDFGLHALHADDGPRQRHDDWRALALA